MVEQGYIYLIYSMQICDMYPTISCPSFITNQPNWIYDLSIIFKPEKAQLITSGDRTTRTSSAQKTSAWSMAVVCGHFGIYDWNRLKPPATLHPAECIWVSNLNQHTFSRFSPTSVKTTALFAPKNTRCKRRRPLLGHRNRLLVSKSAAAARRADQHGSLAKARRWSSCYDTRCHRLPKIPRENGKTNPSRNDRGQ